MGRNRDKEERSDGHKRSSGSRKREELSLQELKIRARDEEMEKIRNNYYKDDRERHRDNDRHGRDRRHGSDRNDYRKRIRTEDREQRNSEQSDEFWSKEAKQMTKTKDEKLVEKAKPNFGLTGKLAEDTNTFNGVVIKYNEPLEARKPKRRWRLYPFKGEESLPFIPIHRQSAYLLGRDRKVADIPVDHPSCSKQHTVIQFRLVEYEREDMSTGKRIRPYIIDLESSNGTFVNNQKIEAKRYYELFEKDVIKFGFSTREYVLLHEESKDETEDDDIVVKDESEIKIEPSL